MFKQKLYRNDGLHRGAAEFYSQKWTWTPGPPCGSPAERFRPRSNEPAGTDMDCQNKTKAGETNHRALKQLHLFHIIINNIIELEAGKLQIAAFVTPNKNTTHRSVFCPSQ